MNKIVLLDEVTANQIAAGEVIERPASVVKELAENAIDAGATQITIEILNGGISYIRITDNGAGIDGEDLEFAFERHATSKLRKINDLDTLSTMGFRGEALASIASVSNVEVISKTREAPTGTKIQLNGGHILSNTKAGSPDGTSFTIRDIFFNTPARYKFLKKDSTEAGYVSEVIVRLALANPGISFKYSQNNKVQLHTPGNNDLLSTVYSIFGKDTAKAVFPINYENNGFKITGFIGKPEIARGNRNNQYIFLNGRYIKNPVITKALEEAYKTILMQKKFPFALLVIETSPQNYDVNVHPQKLEVRFANDSLLFSTIYHGVKNALLGGLEIRGFEKPNNSIEQEATPSSQQTDFSDLNKDKIVDNSVKKMQEDSASTKTLESKKSFYQASQIESGQKIQNENSVEPVDKTNPENSITSYDKTESRDIVISENSIESENSIKSNHDFESEKNIEPGQKDKFVDNSEREINNIEEKQLFIQTNGQNETGAISELLDAKIVGQAFDTYIMLETNNKLYIIDQHAAHERIRYETIKRRLSKKESFSQMVLEPYIIKIKAVEHDFVMEKLESFNALGFDIEPFGTNTIILRSVPDFYDTGFSESNFIEILDRWIEIGSDKNEISDEAIFLISCKGALKANKSLSKEEIRGLVKSLNEMENPYTCVHGRPVILVMDKKEFEKKFKRIV